MRIICVINLNGREVKNPKFDSIGVQIYDRPRELPIILTSWHLILCKW